MSQLSYSRGRFQGRDGGRSSQRNPGRYEAAQAARVPVKLSEDDENFVRYTAEQSRHYEVCRCLEEAYRLCLDHVPGRWKDFVHGYEIKHTYPERPERLEAGESGGYGYERDIYNEKLKMVMKRGGVPL